MIADFDEQRGWEPGGYRSCAHWLMQHIGVDAGTAREKVRVARALRGLPEVSAAMQQGGLSFAKARALTRVATPESEAALLEYAQAHTAAELERLGREWRLLERVDEAEIERRRHRSRCLSVFPDDDGMYIIRGRLDAEVGALLMRAIEAASDAVYVADAEAEVEPQQRRAGALGLLTQAAMAAGFGGAASGNGAGERVAGSSPPADGGPRRRLSGLRAARYTVMLHVEAATLQSGREPGRSSFDDGTRVSAETSRRIACDAGLVRITKDTHGGILDVGRRTRTVPPSLRRALEVRDRGCRFPACGGRFTDAHHVAHWADGGPTRLDNLILLCGYHHRLVHEGGFQIVMTLDGEVTFFDRHGQPVAVAAPRVQLDHDPRRRIVGAAATQRHRTRRPHGSCAVPPCRRRAVAARATRGGGAGAAANVGERRAPGQPQPTAQTPPAPP
jgi:hypothetical protein